LAFADVAGTGSLDLFIGGRVIPGLYPEPATSLLLRNDGGRFNVAQRFEKLGLVSGAVSAAFARGPLRLPDGGATPLWPQSDDYRISLL